jgi:Zn-dependent protease
LLFVCQFDPTCLSAWTVAFILAIAAHEGNHALVATVLGDDTPRRAGRLTLNPLRHVNGTGLIIFVLAGFGWGLTPVDFRKLRPNPRAGAAIVALAGPIANLVLVVLFASILRLQGLPNLAIYFLGTAITLNLILFVLNLIPLPPLDGYTLLVGVLPEYLAKGLQQLERYGLGLIFLVLFVLQFFGVHVLSSVINYFVTPIARILGIPGLR